MTAKMDQPLVYVDHAGNERDAVCRRVGPNGLIDVGVTLLPDGRETVLIDVEFSHTSRPDSWHFKPGEGE